MGRYLGEKGAKFILDLIRPLEAKLNTIAEGANKTVVDSALSSTSTNPVQNKVINTALEGKAARYHDHGCYIDGIAFDTGSNLSRLGTCTTASYDTAKEVTIEGFEETEECANAILYIQFTATYEGGATDTHTISINGGEGVAVYYKGEMLNWETFFSNYPFCDGQIHQFKYFHHPMGTYLELIAVQNRAVANNLTTTNEKIALAAPMGKQLAETDANLQAQISTLNSKSLVYTTTGQQEEITTQQWLNYLVSIGELVTGIITERKMMCQWSYANNKILSDTPVKISLAGCIIELYGIYTGDLSSVHNNFMIRLTGSPAVASAYTSSKNKVYVFRAVGGLTDWLELTS